MVNNNTHSVIRNTANNKRSLSPFNSKEDNNTNNENIIIRQLKSEIDDLKVAQTNSEQKITALLDIQSIESRNLFLRHVFTHERIVETLLFRLNNPTSRRPIKNKPNGVTDFKPAPKTSNTNGEKLYNLSAKHCWWCRCHFQNLVDGKFEKQLSTGLDGMLVVWSNPQSFYSHLISQTCPCFSEMKKSDEGIKKLKEFLDNHKNKLSVYFIPYRLPSCWKLWYDQNLQEYAIRLMTKKNISNEQNDGEISTFYDLFSDYECLPWLQFMHSQLLPILSYKVDEASTTILTAFKPNYEESFQTWFKKYINAKTA